MSKEFTYFEAMEEIIKDKSKKFKFDNNKIMYYDIIKRKIRIKLDEVIRDMYALVDDYWYNTKWILIEEKKTYNIRVYDVKSNKLLESENVTMTEDEINKHCNSKVKCIVEQTTEIRNLGCARIKIRVDSPVTRRNVTRVECEEILGGNYNVI